MMEHVESTIKVYFTKDYSMFNSLKGNRLLNEHKIKRIIRDITGGLNMLRYCPIVVDEKMNVIDGQHRLQVARMLKCSIWYVIRKEETSLHDVAKMNSNTEKWKAKDFLNCYVTQRNQHYVDLDKYHTLSGYNLMTCANLLYNGSVNAGGKDNVKDIFNAGRFEVRFAEYAESFRNAIQLFNRFPEHTTRNFLQAVEKIIKDDKISVIELSDKYERYPDLLTYCDSAKGYLRCFEELYNHRLKQRVVIFA